jgi:hypothetical protein
MPLPPGHRCAARCRPGPPVRRDSGRRNRGGATDQTARRCVTPTARHVGGATQSRSWLGGDVAHERTERAEHRCPNKPPIMPRRRVLDRRHSGATERRRKRFGRRGVSASVRITAYLWCVVPSSVVFGWGEVGSGRQARSRGATNETPTCLPTPVARGQRVVGRVEPGSRPAGRPPGGLGLDAGGGGAQRSDNGRGSPVGGPGGLTRRCTTGEASGRPRRAWLRSSSQSR